MSINTYDIGDSIKSSAAFATAAGVATDPTVIAVSYKIGSGDVTTKTYITDAEVIKDSTGNYHIDLTATVGMWYIRWVGTGAVVAAAESSFYVQPSKVI